MTDSTKCWWVCGETGTTLLSLSESINLCTYCRDNLMNISGIVSCSYTVSLKFHAWIYAPHILSWRYREDEFSEIYCCVVWTSKELEITECREMGRRMWYMQITKYHGGVRSDELDLGMSILINLKT